MHKAFFKVKDDDLDFTRAIEIAIKRDDAAKVAKGTVHGGKPKPVHKVVPWHSRKAKEIKPMTGKSACYR